MNLKKEDSFIHQYGEGLLPLPRSNDFLAVPIPNSQGEIMITPIPYFLDEEPKNSEELKEKLRSF